MLLERCDDQRLFRGLIFFDSSRAGRPVRQTERQIAGRQAGRAAEYQVHLAAAESLAQQRGEQWLLGMPMRYPDSRFALMNVGGKKLLFTEKQSETLFITLPYSLCPRSHHRLHRKQQVYSLTSMLQKELRPVTTPQYCIHIPTRLPNFTPGLQGTAP
ncbi:hypothetical protein PFLUV_G00061890 [Perca fluviatilis]|uniref:Uncharacterized protein n=1 Tax=Perca fluviatilis TaxID=8168 RepID=A0A6A5FFX3_PERFL|nr:hypothetical protein PFLUV_G00061890 [Perca fluviatilis]